MYPLCDPLNYFDEDPNHDGETDDYACMPLTFPVPQNTVQVSVTATCTVTGDLEGMFTREQMPAFLDCVIPMLDDWIDVAATGMPHPNAYIYVPDGQEILKMI